MSGFVKAPPETTSYESHCTTEMESNACCQLTNNNSDKDCRLHVSVSFIIYHISTMFIRLSNICNLRMRFIFSILRNSFIIVPLKILTAMCTVILIIMYVNRLSPTIQSIPLNEITPQYFFSNLVSMSVVHHVDIVNESYARVELLSFGNCSKFEQSSITSSTPVSSDFKNGSRNIPIKLKAIFNSIKKHLTGHPQDLHHHQQKQVCSKLNDHPLQSYIVHFGSANSFESQLWEYQLLSGFDPKNFIPVRHIQEMNQFAEIVNDIICGNLFGLKALSKHGNARYATTEDLNIKVQFSDIAGMQEAKHEIIEFVEFLKNPEKFQKLGGTRTRKGALLVGPPGTGKTSLAKAVAGEARVPFFSVSGSAFIQELVGVGPARVRYLFETARKAAPSIVFNDEIDLIGQKRGGHSNDREHESALGQLLVEMDGFASCTSVIVFAATNRSHVLDPALVRPGRLDRIITFEKPDLAERKEIFQMYLSPLTIDSKLDMRELTHRLAALTTGFVGADIQNICDEAVIYATRRNAEYISMIDFDDAYDRIRIGLRKSYAVDDEETRRTVAYHEAGHAVVAWFLKYGEPVLKISIIPRTNGALGFTQSLPEEARLTKKQKALDRIAILLGGRISEEIFFGEISDGALDDLEKATRIAHSFVSTWGAGEEAGLMSFPRSDSNGSLKPYSPSLEERMEFETRTLMCQQYQVAKEILQEKSELVKSLAEKLLRQETITFNEICDVLGERPFLKQGTLIQYIEASGRKKQPVPLLN